MEQQVHKLYGGWALAPGIVCGAVGGALMKHGSFGLTPFYAVSLSLYEATGFFSMGTWNTIFQTALIALLLVLLRRPGPRYALSFLAAAVSSMILDGMNWLCAFLPGTLFCRVLTFTAGFLVMGLAIALLAECKLPVAPMNLFVREIADRWEQPFKTVKTAFDLACFLFSLAVSLVFVHRLSAIGVGTVIGALFTGPLSGVYIRWLRRYVAFYAAKEA